jgi:Tol biopolymer transport system component
LTLALFLLLPAVSWTAATPESAGILFEEAYFLEQGRGDLEGAIRLYRRIAQEFGNDRKVAARSLLRLGICYERLGADGATQAYRTLIERYGDQPEARIAQEKLRAVERTDSEIEPPGGVRLRQIVLKDGKPLSLPGRLSPDGKTVAYWEWDTMTVNVQSLRRGEIRALTVPRAEFPHYELKWSPDGKKIAYDADLAGDRGVVAIEIDTGRRSIYYRRPGAYSYPLDWSRSGRLLCSVREGDRHFLAVVSAGETPLVREVEGEGFRLSPNGRFVAFSKASTESSTDVFVLDLSEAGEATPVAPHVAQDDQPIWSPDGSLLAFRSHRTGNWDLWASKMEDGKPVGEPILLQKDFGAQVSIDSWLPDGRLSYNKAEGLHDIWILPVSPQTAEAAGKPFLVSQLQGGNSYPFWSPDGDRVAYMSARKGDGKPRVYVTRVDRFEELEIELPCDYFNNPTWSPDGRRIIGIASKAGKNRFFLEWNLTTRSASTFLENASLGGGSPYGHFSPDGKSFLYDGFGALGESLGLHVYDGGSVRKIPGTEGARPGRWSPDGEWIAFKRGKSLWLIRPDGRDLREIPLKNAPALPGFTWSADGRFLAYTSATPALSAWTIELPGNVIRPIEEIDRLGPQRLAWSSDGRHLAVESARTRQQLWLVENLLAAIVNGKKGPRQARRR